VLKRPSFTASIHNFSITRAYDKNVDKVNVIIMIIFFFITGVQSND